MLQVYNCSWVYQLNFYSWLLQIYISCFCCQLLLFANFTAKVFLYRLGKTLVIIVSYSNIDSDITSFSYQLISWSSSTAELFVYGVTDTCSFLDVPFFTAKVFWGDITIFVSYIIYRLNVHKPQPRSDSGRILKLMEIVFI